MEVRLCLYVEGAYVEVGGSEEAFITAVGCSVVSDNGDITSAGLINGFPG
jgi:hypothetical protein